MKSRVHERAQENVAGESTFIVSTKDAAERVKFYCRANLSFDVNCDNRTQVNDHFRRQCFKRYEGCHSAKNAPQHHHARRRGLPSYFQTTGYLKVHDARLVIANIILHESND